MSKVYLEDSVLTDIADAIREKTQKSGLITPADMPDEIESISGGGEPIIESKTITVNGTYTAPSGVDGYSPIVVNVPGGFPQVTFDGFVGYLDYTGNYNWLFTDYIDYITITDVTNITSIFAGDIEIEDLSKLTLPCRNGTIITASSAFSGCRKLKKLPKIQNAELGDTSSLFNSCFNLRYIDNGWEQVIINSGSTYYKQNMFYSCFSLRTIPSNFLNINSSISNTTRGPYATVYFECTSLDEIVNLYPISVSFTADAFSNTFYHCFRLKNLTFQTDNGTPYTRSWKKQRIMLQDIGYAWTDENKITGFNSGITSAKKVTDAASYEALKNDPDWYTTNVDYSRYNHDSAVATINSLPDTSAVSTGTNYNSISFTGASGRLTDGGAINTLTEAEIAVATAKGWTVSMS